MENLLLERLRETFSNNDVLPANISIPNFKVGDKLLNRYEVKTLYKGAMGDVYHCYDSRRKTDVALKTIISNRKEDRFQLESFFYESLRRLHIVQHPNVLKLKRIEMIDGYYYIVSEWISGDAVYGNSLSTWMERYAFSLPEIMNFMQQMLAGLAHCHKNLGGADKTYVFGDLKPDNILIDNRRVLKLADFSGGYTPGWSAPEQSKGSTVIPDVRSDIYSMAAITSAMLSKVAEFGNPLRDAMDHLLEQCLEPDIEDRIPSLQDLKTALNSICEQFGLEPYIDPAPPANTDTLLWAVAYMRPGSYLTASLPLDTQSFECIKRRRHLSIEDFCEYTYGDSLVIYEAKLDYAQGNVFKALERLKGKSGSAELFYIRAVMFYATGDLNSAMLDLAAAISKEDHLPAYDLMANLFLDYPEHTRPYNEFIKVNLEKLETFQQNRFAGYMANQAMAKYYMLCGQNASAQKYFWQCMHYPNFNDEWRTMYYYGCCECQAHNFYRARIIFNYAIELIQADSAYLKNKYKCIILLFCNNQTGQLAEVVRLSSHIKAAFAMDYSSLAVALQQELVLLNSYMQAVQYAESRLAMELSALQTELLRMMEDIEMKNHFSNMILRSDITATIASRATYCAAQRQMYETAVAICDQALAFDHSNAVILQNRESCLRACHNES